MIDREREGIRPKRRKAPYRRLIGNAQAPADGKGQRDVFGKIDPGSPRNAFKILRRREADAAPKSLRSFAHAFPEVSLRRKDAAALRQHFHQTRQDLPPRFSHHVHVVEPRIGDHADIVSEHVSGRDPLVFRLQRHALDHQDVGLFLRGGMQVFQLLADVRRSASSDLLLAAVRMEAERKRPRRLAHDPVPAGSQSGRNKARDRRFAPGPVHIDHMLQFFPVLPRPYRFSCQKGKIQSGKEQDRYPYLIHGSILH